MSNKQKLTVPSKVPSSSKLSFESMEEVQIILEEIARFKDENEKLDYVY